MDNRSDKNDDIDFATILTGIKKMIFSFWRFLVTCVIIIQRRWWIFFLFALLGVGAGYASFGYFRPVYISYMSVSSKILSNDYCADIIENLGEVVKDGTTELLARRLNISVSSAKQIKRIEYSNYNEKLSKMYEDKDTIVLGIPFKIIVYSFNNTVFDSLEPALVTYLENNDYSLKRKIIKKQNFERLREKLNKEMIQLDSLKKNISENVLPRGTASGFVFGQPIDPINIYKAGIDLFRNDLALREEILFSDGIQVVDGFSPRDKPDYPRLWMTISACVSIMLLLAFIISYWLESKESQTN